MRVIHSVVIREKPPSKRPRIRRKGKVGNIGKAEIRIKIKRKADGGLKLGSVSGSGIGSIDS